METEAPKVKLNGTGSFIIANVGDPVTIDIECSSDICLKTPLQPAPHQSRPDAGATSS